MNARNQDGTGGFTLIELMIVVSIIGILASIAIPKFADLVRKAREGKLKGDLGTLRSALSIYYSDMEGQYPGAASGPCGAPLCWAQGALNSLTMNGKYIAAVPTPYVPDYHVIWAGEPEQDYGSTQAQSISYFFTNVGDLSGWSSWIYFSDPAQITYGQVFVFCTHTDSKGTAWSVY